MNVAASFSSSGSRGTAHYRTGDDTRPPGYYALRPMPPFSYPGCPGQRPPRQQPRPILGVDLALRHRLVVLGIDQNDGAVPLQDVEHGLPVAPRMLHGHMRHPLLRQPMGQRQEHDCGLTRAHRTRPSSALAGQPHASHHRRLIDIQPTTPLVHDPHGPPPSGSTGRWPLDQEISQSATHHGRNHVQCLATT
jgi:hypothetical protein